ncbi:alpha-D-ribose 1-methylphosphonate 5-triphosphate synthase subunit PhnG [Tistlia consotensis]|uniref:Alpha-D-ribose 1-methylphosphonate 5-triphosphate synthase subunit PhnG n=1 Tax=Tistlia consotensis USBA 355 TaxID=560819 RepID=A0A1Y6CPZ6_9PROT|nr:phosphonate C-P lyase system protein PhnG [Tistlia consotensis]SMF80429.1 alpha-D-ribose 1-methylphosphonate 5-triphosphate synthase subunit PhnG [Tistlia consotensis USBA 355]SNR62675.1 alpha-D-ribose 1-methylphosphonate 5-triphosphate synthase subunit PhnG [Tistlia consotensis]
MSDSTASSPIASSQAAPDLQQSLRRDWMSVLARAEAAELERLWQALDEPAGHRLLRRPETGLVQLRGRIGGDGAPFNVGEAPVTRCSLVVEGERVGHAYVLGRDLRHAELAALLDALLQDPARRPRLLEAVIEPLRTTQAARRRARRRAAETTRVDFFTLVRGEASK